MTSPARHRWSFARLSTFALMLVAGPALAATPAPFSPFSDVAEEAAALLPEREAAWHAPLPARYRVLELDRGALDALLAAAPVEGAPGGALEMALPYPDGRWVRFAVRESSILEPALAAKFPELRTFTVQGIDDRAATGRVSLTPLGFHAMVLSPAGSVYIDPWRRGDDRWAIAYFSGDARRAPGDRMVCEVEGGEPRVEELDAAAPVTPLTPSGTTLRTYRLALAATGEYSTRVCQPNPAAVACSMAAIVVSMNRVVGIYEREVAVRMVLVANNDLVVYTNGATDPYTNNNGSTMLGQNQTNLNAVIGTANYDVGHVFSTGGGGVAFLGVICTSNKARGVTGSSNPVGDGFDVDYVAHEMGHQFGGDHSFNGTTGACNGNRVAASAYEPGSASTIMGYAGICGAEDLQPHSDDTFHVRNLNQILAHTTGGGAGNACDVETATGNNPPVVEAGPAYTIPKQTPFTLTGSATDADGDPLTYLWEEFDLGTASPPNTDSGNRPIFRTFVPLTTPSRTFPRMSDVLANVATLGESMATTSRTMNFRLSVRDNRTGGGGVDNDATTVTVNAGAGPFLVTAPNTAVTWAGGGNESVTWDTANTAAVPVSCATVKIELSLDGGVTFPTLLATTANDGNESVTAPAVVSTESQARIRVACSGNIFFDVSNANFSIVPGLVQPTIQSIDPPRGIEDGNTLVSITGTGFIDGATVTFGGEPATEVVYLDATSLTARTPAHDPGAVDVVVDQPDTSQATATGGFEYLSHTIFVDGLGSGNFGQWSDYQPQP